MVNMLMAVLVAISAISILALDATNIFAQSTNMTGNSSSAANTTNSTMGNSTSKGTSDGQGNTTLQAQSGRISGCLRGCV
jgi:hypothetical protein